MVWVEGALKLIPFHHLPLAERSSTRPRCSKSCPARPGTLPGMGSTASGNRQVSTSNCCSNPPFFFWNPDLFFKLHCNPCTATASSPFKPSFVSQNWPSFSPFSMWGSFLLTLIDHNPEWTNPPRMHKQTCIYYLRTLEDSFLKISLLQCANIKLISKQVVPTQTHF